ncbi:MAG: TRAP transporter small permease [Peptoniphilaceae bacterium]|nr:TRAP transporter small permease [Peptoniphilaceae bacterium]
MKTLRNTLIKILEWLSIFLLIAITALGTWQVFSRFLLHKPSAWSEELLSYGFTWLVCTASALIFGKRGHMRLTFLLDRFSPKVRKWIEILLEGISALFAILVFIYGGFKIMGLTMPQVTPALQLSTGVLYSILPVTGVLTVIFCVLNMIEIARGEIFVAPSDEENGAEAPMGTEGGNQ